MENTSIKFYDTVAEKYFLNTVHANLTESWDLFINSLTSNTPTILDAGCGSGRDTAEFISRGAFVDAFDGSVEMTKQATEYTNIDIKHCLFTEFQSDKQYDGIWASASLLHVLEVDLPATISHLKQFLKPNGVMYASFKSGSDASQNDLRHFTNLTLDKAKQLFESVGFKTVSTSTMVESREGVGDVHWTIVIAK
ncbi:class I SAM-dependent methyltransferase [Vibrio alginolyticus]|uniref:class I SAM-dependent methyltransferase n=1 Tax=Vibrio alginolyticus TaxID=663 RepID=UPI0006CA6226|nr:class I SAM-dependent methyltransferase [Vibrio alginolyticus]